LRARARTNETSQSRPRLTADRTGIDGGGTHAGPAETSGTGVSAPPAVAAPAGALTERAA
jgi:hypothetical protein